MKTKQSNPIRIPGYNQVCIWEGVTLDGAKPETFEKYIESRFNGVKVQFLECIDTLPDKDKAGNIVKNTGGRSDLFFAIHEDDIDKFAVPRLNAGIRWLDDAISIVNGGNRLYPERVMAYKTWEEQSNG